MRNLFGCLLCLALGFTVLRAGELPSLLNGNGRVILVGDSITGLSRNNAAGYAHQMEAALKAVYPGSQPDIVSLGGSGQSVESWQSVELNSRTKEAFLDVKGIEVKAALSKPADVLVVMLGMNNVIAPYTSDTPQSLDKWEKNYQALIEALRLRVQPKLIALGGITPATEDPESPKNKLIALMNERVRALAQRVQGRYLPTSENVLAVLEEGRSRSRNFHVTYDFVHPTEAGHIAIACGMLQGLGEDKAAQWLKDQRLAKVWGTIAAKKEPFSWSIRSAFDAKAPDRMTLKIRYWQLNSAADAQAKPQVSLTAPQGWEVEPQTQSEPAGEFTVRGTPALAQTPLTLQAGAGGEGRQAVILIPAPWLIGLKFVQPWGKDGFNAAASRTPLDEVIEKNADFTAAIDLGGGKQLSWQPYLPSVNYTGQDDPASVDFSALTHAQTFEGAYAARWVYSEKARPVLVEAKAQLFAGNVYMTLWLNGKSILSAPLNGKGTTVEAELLPGWNVLVYKANHRAWLWQASVKIAGKDGDALADLRYSLSAHAPGSAGGL